MPCWTGGGVTTPPESMNQGQTGVESSKALISLNNGPRFVSLY